MARQRQGASRPAGSVPARERLQKVLARAGLGSRRAIETWIAAGRVTVNGRAAGLGDGVAPGDRIQVDGRPVPAAALAARPAAVLGLHKPSGRVCSRRDPQGRPDVYELLPAPPAGRWISVGRLDFNTSGLLLFTTDGELAHRLMHPRQGLVREYAVRVRGTLDAGALQQLRTGVELEDGGAAFDAIEDAGGEGSNHWYRVSLREGRRREVRRLVESQGVAVSRLIRVRYGPITLPRTQRAGSWWQLGEAQVGDLLRAAGMAAAPDAPPRPRNAAPGRRPRRPGHRRG